MADMAEGTSRKDQILQAFFDALQKAKPAEFKGTYLKKAAISSTMGPGIRLDTTTLASA